MLSVVFRERMHWLVSKAAYCGLAIYAHNEQTSFATISNDIYSRVADLDFETAAALLRAGSELARITHKPLTLSLPYGLSITIRPTLEGEPAIQAEAAVIISVLTARKLEELDRD